MTEHDIRRIYHTKNDASIDHNMRQWRLVIKGLGKRGARFVAIRAGQKLPSAKGWNQTENTLTTEQALAHLKTGGSVGHAAGTGNVYCFDFDRDADRGHESHIFDGGLYVHRTNAPHKAKFYFTCDEAIPTRPRSRQHGFDLIGFNSNGTHAQSVIAGIHPSGDPYLWGGHTVPHLSIDTVAALFADFADGEELFPPVRERTTTAIYDNVPLARVADALQHVDPNDMDYNHWIGLIAAIHDAFDGSDEALDVAVEWADGKPGEVETKWRSFDREYSGQPATLDGLFRRARRGGWQDVWLAEQLDMYRHWIASPDCIEALKEAGFKTPENARKLLDAILAICEHKQDFRVSPGYAALVTSSSITLGGLNRYFARLFCNGFINFTPGEKGGRAAEIELVFRNVNSYLPDGNAIHVAKNWKTYREYRGDEAFMNNHHAYSSTRTRADLKPLGANGLGVLMALLDGPVTTREAADLLGYSYASVAATMRRYVDHAMVDVEVGQRNRKTYTLKGEWRDILSANTPRMTTAAVQLTRKVQALKSRFKIAEYKGNFEKADKLKVEHERQSATLGQIKEQLGIVPFVRPGCVDPHVERLGRLNTLISHGERIEQKPKKRGYVPLLPNASIFGADAEWDALNAWAKGEYGIDWWVKRGVKEILAAYERFLSEPISMPTIHWDGHQPTCV